MKSKLTMMGAIVLAAAWIASNPAAAAGAPPARGSGLEARPTADVNAAKNQPSSAAKEAAPGQSRAGDAPSQPGNTVESIAAEAEVIEVTGDVRRAATGTKAAQDDGWEPVKVKERLGGGTLIRTGLRSLLVLRFGADTYVRVDRATLATISEFVRRGDVDDVHLGLGYGAIRGGTSAGKVRSELTVESPAATLAKRGTRDWEIRVEPGTSRFTIALATEGLVDAIRKVESGRSPHRLVHPGEYATQDNIARMWLKQAQFDRAFRFFNPEGLTASDVEFAVAKARGLATIAPADGSQTRALVRRDDVPASEDIPVTRSLITRVLVRPEGNFGTARPGSN